MNKFREKIAVRGTADCPFQRYSIKRSCAGDIISNIHWHPEAEILYMRQGTVEVHADKTAFLLSPQEIAFIPPGQLHTVYSTTNDCNYDAFVFSLDLIKLPESHFFQKEVITPLWSGRLRFPYLLTPADDEYPAVSQALDIVCKTENKSSAYKRTVFISTVQILTAMMDKLLPGSSISANKSNEIFKSCLHYMNQNFANRITLRELADHVHLHPNYLCALFKDYTGQTVFQHLIRIRIENAAELLRSQDISVSDTAALCGFESTSFFAKKFKAIMGVTPKEYSIQHK